MTLHQKKVCFCLSKFFLSSYNSKNGKKSPMFLLCLIVLTPQSTVRQWSVKQPSLMTWTKHRQWDISYDLVIVPSAVDTWGGDDCRLDRAVTSVWHQGGQTGWRCHDERDPVLPLSHSHTAAPRCSGSCCGFHSRWQWSSCVPAAGCTQPKPPLVPQ